MAPTSVHPTTTAAPPVSSAPTAGSVAEYGQCGGIGWAGATGCVAGFTCTVLNCTCFARELTEFVDADRACSVLLAVLVGASSEIQVVAVESVPFRLSVHEL